MVNQQKEHKLVNTNNYLVQIIKNSIKEYGASPIRALAQEPVQNAIDARVDNLTKVRVVYRLLRKWDANGQLCMMLTVTDRGTFGLRGPVVTPEELEKRGFKLRDDENWAAFEGHGYTKENETSLGSRGQGKAAFLYFSNVPRTNNDVQRMLILTLYYKTKHIGWDIATYAL